MNKYKILLHKNATNIDIDILDHFNISVTEDDFINNDNKRIFEYHAHCNNNTQKEVVNNLNNVISRRKDDKE